MVFETDSSVPLEKERPTWLKQERRGKFGLGVANLNRATLSYTCRFQTFYLIMIHHAQVGSRHMVQMAVIFLLCQRTTADLIMSMLYRILRINDGTNSLHLFKAPSILETLLAFLF
jgi:hypothetical protein